MWLLDLLSGVRRSVRDELGVSFGCKILASAAERNEKDHAVQWRGLHEAECVEGWLWGGESGGWDVVPVRQNRFQDPLFTPH